MLIQSAVKNILLKENISVLLSKETCLCTEHIHYTYLRQVVCESQAGWYWLVSAQNSVYKLNLTILIRLLKCLNS